MFMMNITLKRRLNNRDSELWPFWLHRPDLLAFEFDLDFRVSLCFDITKIVYIQYQKRIYHQSESYIFSIEID